MEAKEKESDSELSECSVSSEFPAKPRGRPPRNKRKATESPPMENTDDNRRKSSRTRNTVSDTPQAKINTSASTNSNIIRSSPSNSNINPYKSLFFINTTQIKSRVEMAKHWGRMSPQSTDIILQTSKGFLLKSNTPKEQLITILDGLKMAKHIDNFSETTAYTTDRTKITPPETFAAVITQVDFEIDDQTISEALNNNNITHRFCKRITSRATSKPTTLIRIITGNAEAFRKLMSEGVFLLNKHFRASPSTPPTPVPQPCTKCTQFTHTTENCPNELLCSKCSGNHRTERCTSNLPLKCTSCNAVDHVAWSIKCPHHPRKPIEGIPNAQIKPLNKKSREINNIITNNNRIHASITMHDYIINTYSRKINNPTTINREELILALKKRFIKEFNIETTVAFSGNWMYILMIDLENPGAPSPTEPTKGASFSVIKNVP